jgi:hypothetical protein
MSFNPGNNIIVYQIPGLFRFSIIKTWVELLLLLTDTIPLETVLRQLGVDVNALNGPSSVNNYYPGK